MLIEILLLILGLLLLIKGADWLVDGAVALAKRYKVSDLAVGLTIVAFGTSAPELVVNVYAASQKHYDIVFGNVIGSNNFNLFIILGITGLISPLVVKSSTVWKEIPLSFIAALLLFLMANEFLFHEKYLLSRIDGLVFLIMFGIFLFYVFNQLKHDAEVSEITYKPLSTTKLWVFIIIGLAGLIIGGRLVVTSAIDLAKALNVSEKIIGLTIVAAGTSLPELVTSIVASLKKNNDIAVGNIIGSNIFNIFLILAISSLINPLSYNPGYNRDLYLLLGGTAFLFIAMFTGGKKKLDRWEAGLMLIIYIGYTYYLITWEL